MRVCFAQGNASAAENPPYFENIIDLRALTLRTDNCSTLLPWAAWMGVSLKEILSWWGVPGSISKSNTNFSESLQCIAVDLQPLFHELADEWASKPLSQRFLRPLSRSNFPAHAWPSRWTAALQAISWSFLMICPAGPTAHYYKKPCNAYPARSTLQKPGYSLDPCPQEDTSTLHFVPPLRTVCNW